MLVVGVPVSGVYMSGTLDTYPTPAGVVDSTVERVTGHRETMALWGMWHAQDLWAHQTRSAERAAVEAEKERQARLLLAGVVVRHVEAVAAAQVELAGIYAAQVGWGPPPVLAVADIRVDTAGALSVYETSGPSYGLAAPVPLSVLDQ